MSFAKQVERFCQKAQGKADKTVRAITFALFREVIMRTPVDTGRLKANWQVSIGAPASGTVEAVDKSGSRTIANMAAGMGGWGTYTALTNNLPYAYRIEFDGWSHTKAPQGMVRVSMARIESIVRKAARSA